MTPSVVITFHLFLILLPDIEKEEYVIHRLKFETQESCMYFAERLDQVRDPIARKKQCRAITNYLYPEEFL
jgi:hypothetical protein